MATKQEAVAKRLTAEDILAAPDIVWEDVLVPEWDGVVTVRSLTGAERDKLEASAAQMKGSNIELNLTNTRAKWVAASAVTEVGSMQPLFSQSQVVALGQKNAKALSRLWDVSRRLSGMSDEDVKELTVSLGNGQSADAGSA